MIKLALRAKLNADSLALEALGSVRYAKLKKARHPGARFLPAYHQGRYIFVHIPKTGGTSISKLLTSDFQATHSHYMLDDYYAENQRAAADYFKFCVIRNPWDRLVSSYHHLHDLPPWVGASTQRFVRMAGLTYATFDEFINRLASERWLRMWPHFRSQWCYVRHGNCNGMDHVIRFERFVQDIAQVADRLGITDINVPEENVSKRKRDYHAYYNDDTAAVVGKLYARDISEFGYEF